MRFVPAALAALSLFLSGCCSIFCPRPDAVRLYTDRDTPEQAFETFRSALAVRAPDVIWESLSRGFREKWDVPGLATFKTGYELYLADFDELGAILAGAEVERVEYREEADGRRAYVTIRAAESEGEFVLVDQPSWKARLRLEGYEDEPPDEVTGFLAGADFSEVLRVEDGRLFVGPLDASDLAPEKPSEVLRVMLQHEWLLDDVRRLVNVRPLLDRFQAVDAENPENQ